ncbi:hypothetical protein ACFQ2C_06510 [Sphingobacterium daejeonense]|jgi:hypothetical protein|uniref:Uncharacterized protein n=1 Tax=Sphingobacterium daejeonense TaxID=371142 RepID=A0ABW3RKH8_9SPHI
MKTIIKKEFTVTHRILHYIALVIGTSDDRTVHHRIFKNAMDG